MNFKCLITAAQSYMNCFHSSDGYPCHFSGYIYCNIYCTVWTSRLTLALLSWGAQHFKDTPFSSQWASVPPIPKCLRLRRLKRAGSAKTQDTIDLRNLKFSCYDLKKNLNIEKVNRIICNRIFHLCPFEKIEKHFYYTPISYFESFQSYYFFQRSEIVFWQLPVKYDTADKKRNEIEWNIR